MLALGVCASLAMGSLGFTGSAEARINGARLTQKAQICGLIQDAFDEANDDLGYVDPFSQEGQAITDDILFWWQAWTDQGCDSDYGPLTSIPAPLSPAKHVSVPSRTSTFSR